MRTRRSADGREAKTLFGVPKRKAVLCALFVAAGLVFGAIGSVCGLCLGGSMGEVLHDVFFCLAGGLLPSGITGYLVELVSARSERERRLHVRSFALRGIPCAVEFLMRKTVGLSLVGFEENRVLTLDEAFKLSVEKMQSYPDEGVFDDPGITRYAESFIESVGYASDLLERDVPVIDADRAYYLQEGIFTEDEICVIQCLLDQMRRINEQTYIQDLGAYLEMLVGNGSRIEEIKSRTCYKIKFGKKNNFRIIARD